VYSGNGRGFIDRLFQDASGIAESFRFKVLCSFR
jgi:hypothetical protein